MGELMSHTWNASNCSGKNELGCREETERERERERERARARARERERREEREREREERERRERIKSCLQLLTSYSPFLSVGLVAEP